ncbi:exodeoxyribonuclease VII large subunit [Brevibacillus humidisoli]|uniref:exodeoxyribonuclease VII large subunit n=1 Tax=Brevibacillus humidisoli TaxID=2895522 RepID=UPI001E3F5B6A|nr:exodeoxyribonuclease VII large subunit [Brevibacillus humidisoli]UFJ42908.1 exodeoxyribonuclease VII large subunit [Brevibacillus humidisoli]
MSTPEIWTVSQLTRHVKQTLERSPQLTDVWIRGEISNFTHHTSGHMYFTLKDAQSRIKVVMFSSYNRFLRFLPKNGTKAIVRGSISVYERDGNYQLYAREMQPDGLGSLYLAFQQLKEKLQSEGLFAPERKRPLPSFPRAIGVVTSPTGAAVRDIVTTIKRRFPQAVITVIPAIVQGEEAPASIEAAIRRCNECDHLEVLIVGRGGGSIEELWAFNDERVARAIAASRVPVISAVGHETDFTIADFVADIRAATPTAAAELAVPHYLEWLERTRQLEHRLHRVMNTHLHEQRERLNRLSAAYGMRLPQRRIEESHQQLDEWINRLRLTTRQLVRRKREQYTLLSDRLQRYRFSLRLKQHRQIVLRGETALRQAMQRRIQQARRDWNGLVGQLDALSPLKVMQRGYALVYREQKLVKHAAAFAPGDKLMVRLQDGIVHADVTEIVREENEHGPQER